MFQPNVKITKIELRSFICSLNFSNWPSQYCGEVILFSYFTVIPIKLLHSLYLPAATRYIFCISYCIGESIMFHQKDVAGTIHLPPPTISTVIQRRFISVDDSLINGNHFSVTKDKRVCGSCSACVAKIISGATDNLPRRKRKDSVPWGLSLSNI